MVFLPHPRQQEKAGNYSSKSFVSTIQVLSTKSQLSTHVSYPPCTMLYDGITVNIGKLFRLQDMDKNIVDR